MNQHIKNPNKTNKQKHRNILHTPCLHIVCYFPGNQESKGCVY